MNDDAPAYALARRLLRSGAQVVGFVPGHPAAPVEPTTRAVAHALAAVGGRPVGVVAAHARWGDTPPEAAGAGVVMLALPAEPDALAAVGVLCEAVRLARQRFDQVLVDLSGLYPELTLAERAADAFVTVAAAGVAREQELERVHLRLPPDRALGVVLMG